MLTEIALIGRGRWGQNYINTLHPRSVWGKNYRECQNWPSGVIIATPTSTHFEVAEQVIITGGQNLLIEKPLTATLAQANKLQSLVEQSNTHIMVGHLMLYDSAIQKMFTLAASPTTMEFYGLQSPTRTDATVLQDWGAHPLYLALHLFGNKPKEISATPTQNDNVELTANFSDKQTLKAVIGWTSPEKRRTIKISGSKGVLTLDWSNGPKALQFNGQPIDLPQTPSPLEAEITAFTNFIKTGETLTPLSQGIEVVKLIEMAEKSLQTGKTIAL